MDSIKFRQIIEKLTYVSPKILAILLCYFNDIMSKCIEWSIEDFEQRAKELENANTDFETDEQVYIPEYDRSKFEQALLDMIHKHDRNLGITWNTIDYYLDEWCKIENNKVKVQFLIHPIDGLFAYFSDDKICYCHVGQHSECHIDYVNESKIASENEYKKLMKELIDKGYKI